MNPQFLQPTLDLLQIPVGHLNLMGDIDYGTEDWGAEDWGAKSEVDGLECRAVVRVQGCLRHCPHCFNPDAWSFEINHLVTVEALAHQILNNPDLTGVTFSGGEPFWQAPALAHLAQRVKAAGLHVMAFTGFTLEQLHDPYGPAGAKDLLQELDLLVAGPYIASLAVRSPKALVSSSNQQVHVFDPQLQTYSPRKNSPRKTGSIR